jgi:hypothetical protein
MAAMWRKKGAIQLLSLNLKYTLVRSSESTLKSRNSVLGNKDKGF